MVVGGAGPAQHVPVELHRGAPGGGQGVGRGLGGPAGGQQPVGHPLGGAPSSARRRAVAASTRSGWASRPDLGRQAEPVGGRDHGAGGQRGVDHAVGGGLVEAGGRLQLQLVEPAPGDRHPLEGVGHLGGQVGRRTAPPRRPAAATTTSNHPASGAPAGALAGHDDRDPVAAGEAGDVVHQRQRLGRCVVGVVDEHAARRACSAATISSSRAATSQRWRVVGRSDSTTRAISSRMPGGQGVEQPRPALGHLVEGAAHAGERARAR